MNNASKVIIGKYKNPEDVKATLQRLKREGYKREDVTLYTNNKDLDRFGEENEIDMLADETKTVEMSKEDRSFWDRVKDMISYEDTERLTADERENEWLEPYREDISNGYTIIAVREDIGKLDINKPSPTQVLPQDNKKETLYETERDLQAMNHPDNLDSNRLDNRDDEIENNDIHSDFDSIYESDKKPKEDDDLQFLPPGEFETGVTGDDYKDIDQLKRKKSIENRGNNPTSEI